MYPLSGLNSQKPRSSKPIHNVLLLSSVMVRTMLFVVKEGCDGLIFLNEIFWADAIFVTWSIVVPP